MKGDEMKKVLAGLVAGLLLFVVVGVASANTTTVTTNSLGQVITVITTAGGEVVSAVVTPVGLPASVTRSETSLSGVQIDTAVTTTTTAYTPRDIGDFLVGHVGTGTNGIWMAVGVATSDWVKIN